jgi:hypothetical protein
MSFDLDLGLIHMPADPDRPLTTMEGVFHLETIFQDPAVHSRVVDRHPAFLRAFFHIMVTQGIGQIPPHAGSENYPSRNGLFEAHHCRTPALVSLSHSEGVFTPDSIEMEICDRFVGTHSLCSSPFGLDNGDRRAESIIVR